MTNINGIITEFNQSKKELKELETASVQLIRKLFDFFDIRIHLVQHRVKDAKSLEHKISNPDKEYENIYSITDLVGLRIITYFEKDIYNVSRVIEDEFIIDYENSIDKRKTLGPSNFGYLSLHYICQFDNKRTKLSEYKNLNKWKFEIQVRSILQHSWAEIEHDLGYKNQLYSTPKLTRSFARIAALLEVADNEFTEIEKYIQQVVTNDNSQLITIDNLQEIIDGNIIISEIDNTIPLQVTKNVTFQLNKEKYFKSEYVIECLNRVEIFTENQLITDLEKFKNDIGKAMILIVDKSQIHGFDPAKESKEYNAGKGYSLLLLPFAKILFNDDLESNKYQNLRDFFSLEEAKNLENSGVSTQERELEIKRYSSNASDLVYSSYLKNIRTT